MTVRVGISRGMGRLLARVVCPPVPIENDAKRRSCLHLASKRGRCDHASYAGAHGLAVNAQMSQALYLVFASEPRERALRTEHDLARRVIEEPSRARERIGVPGAKPLDQQSGEVAERLKAAVC